MIGGNTQLANTIAYNAAAGIALHGEDTTGNSIRANSIFANGALGIDLGIDGVTANDAADPDLGPNKLQNYPVIDAVVVGASTRVVGSLNSIPNTEFTLDFYANSVADPSGYGEGERWLGSTLVTTDAGGDATFDVLLPAATTGRRNDHRHRHRSGRQHLGVFRGRTSYVPLAVDDAYLVDVNTQLAPLAASGVLANDYGADSMEAVWVSGPSHGLLALQPDGSFVYDPALDFNGYDSFTYMAADGPLESDPVTVSIFVAESLGPLAFRELDGQDPSAGDVYYQWTTTHDAFLTLEALFDAAAGTAELTLYDGACTELATSTLVGENQRIDWEAVAGERYFLKLSGTNADVDLRLANLVSHIGTTVTVYGTLDEDLFEFDAAASRLVTINGVSYHFTDAEATSISFDGAAAADTAILNGNDQNETAELWPEQGTLVGDDYSVAVSSVETITAHGGGGVDLAFLHDDPLAKDTLTGGPDAATLSGNPYSNQVANFRYVHVYGTPGDGDEAMLQGDPDVQDTFEAWPGEAKISPATPVPVLSPSEVVRRRTRRRHAGRRRRRPPQRRSLGHRHLRGRARPGHPLGRRVLRRSELVPLRPRLLHRRLRRRGHARRRSCPIRQAPRLARRGQAFRRTVLPPREVVPAASTPTARRAAATWPSCTTRSPTTRSRPGPTGRNSPATRSSSK